MFKNFNLQAIKYQFTIDLKDVILPDMYDEFDGTETLCIAFERKNKNLTYTEEKSISLNDNEEIVADFTNDSFLTEVTLYRDPKTGCFKEKVGSLTLLQRKYGVSGSTREAFKTLGIAHIPFHQYTDGKSHEKELYFGGAVSDSARIRVIIAGVAKDGSKYNISVDDGDERSIASSQANTANTAHQNPDYNNKDQAKTNIPFWKGSTPSAATSNTSSYSSNLPPPPPPASSSRALTTSTTHNNRDSDTIQMNSMLSFHSQDDKKFESTFLYQNMKKRLQELEDTILSSEEIMAYDKTQIKELSSRKAELETENEKLRAQNSQMAFQLEHLQTDYEILMKDSESLKATMAKYNLEGGKLQSLLSKATEELNLQLDAKNKLEQLLKEKNNECEDLLAELIKTKVAVGDLNGELDETKKQLRALRGGGGGGGGSRASNSNSNGSRSNGEPVSRAIVNNGQPSRSSSTQRPSSAGHPQPPPSNNRSSGGPPPSRASMTTSRDNNNTNNNQMQYSNYSNQSSTPSYNPYSNHNNNNNYSSNPGPPYHSSTDYYYQNSNPQSTPYSTPSHQPPPQQQRDYHQYNNNNSNNSDYNPYESRGRSSQGPPPMQPPPSNSNSSNNGKSGSLMRGFGGW